MDNEDTKRPYYLRPFDEVASEGFPSCCGVIREHWENIREGRNPPFITPYGNIVFRSGESWFAFGKNHLTPEGREALKC